MQMLQVNVRNAQARAVGFAEVPDTIVLVAWLHRDALVKRIEAEVTAESDDAAALFVGGSVRFRVPK